MCKINSFFSLVINVVIILLILLLFSFNSSTSVINPIPVNPSLPKLKPVSPTIPFTSIKSSNSFYKTQSRTNVSFPDFPNNIGFHIKLVFIGFNRFYVNTSKLLDLIPDFSQISRYVPLSFEYETYIDYSITYDLFFMEDQTAIDLSFGSSSFGNYPYSLKLGLYWNQFTNVNYYQRLDISSVKNWFDTKINFYKTDQGSSVSIDPLSPTIFFVNMFTNGSKFYQNNQSIPHTYYLEKNDLDTGAISNIRNLGKFSPGFSWEDKRWLFLDLSSGPSEYENIWNEYSNFVEYLNHSITPDDSASELASLVRGAVFSDFLPTYLYVPSWKPTVELCISLYHDDDFSAIDYLNINKITSSFSDLLYDRTVLVKLETIPVSDGDELDIYLDEISGHFDYSIWAQHLCEFVKFKEYDLFGNFDSSSIDRHLIGIFATNKISGKDSSLGFTYGYLGTGHPLAAIVTITPDSIINKHEGLTQTTIHELGHSLSLRHPHDYRYYGNIYKIWSWDTVSTPLSYFHSVYDWDIFNKDTLFRGNFRFLFNETITNIHETRKLFLSLNFPHDSYPYFYYNSFLNISSVLSSSLQSFFSLDYQTSLLDISHAYHLSNDLLINASSLPSYSSPIINFNTVNDTTIDYGNDIDISGTIVSYDNPNVDIFSINWNDSFIVTSSVPLLGHYESSFSRVISTILFGEIDAPMILIISVDDSVLTYYYKLLFSLSDLRVSIISPSNKMTIDLSISTSFKVCGNYYSFSNSSKIQILFGHYWYVKDHYTNSSYWHDVSKSLGNQWQFVVNVSDSNITNGCNLISIRISNHISENIDEIELDITGLPEIENTTTSNPTSSFDPPINELNQPSSDPLLQWFPIIIGFSFFSLISSWKFHSIRSNKNLTITEASSNEKIGKKITDLKTAVRNAEHKKDTSLSGNTNLNKPPKKKFKPRRRRTINA